MEFFENEFIEKTERSSTAIRYEDLFEILESKTNFYLMLAKNQGATLLVHKSKGANKGKASSVKIVKGK